MGKIYYKKQELIDMGFVPLYDDYVLIDASGIAFRRQKDVDLYKKAKVLISFYGRVNRPDKEQKPYKHFSYTNHGKQTNVYLHRALADAFIPAKEGTNVTFRDGNTVNNSAIE